MRHINIEVPAHQSTHIRISLKEGIKRPVITSDESLARIPFVGSFLVKNIESLGYTLGGNYEELPDEINQVRWGIIDGGFTDQEVYNEVKQTLKSASGGAESKNRIGQHVSELLLPLVA